LNDYFLFLIYEVSGILVNKVHTSTVGLIIYVIYQSNIVQILQNLSIYHHILIFRYNADLIS